MLCEWSDTASFKLVQNYILTQFILQTPNEQKNVFLYTQNGFVVTFKSFINQVPCDYHTQAMTDASVIYICITDLLDLYKQSHKWECFGRLLAQEAFNVAIERAESFLLKRRSSVTLI